MFERQSALTGALQLGGHDGASGLRQLRLGEARDWELVQIAAFAQSLDALEEAVRPLLSADLPARVGEAVVAGERCLMKTGPMQFWIISRGNEDLARPLRAAITTDTGAVTPLSHSRTCIFIEGSRARELLAQGMALDLHLESFRTNSFALTNLHHTPVLLHRSGESRYELYAMRTFALSIWEWLIDAALPYGYEVVKTG
ncbi:MAG TPA: sarcosine oxidase subunit gamma family protein [Steroidobacteraceae bacterium]